MVNGSAALATGLDSIKATAAGLEAKTKTRKPKKAAVRKPKTQPKKAAKSNGSGMNGPHRPKVLAANVEEEVHKAFRQIAINENTSIQRLVCEGLNLVLADRKVKTRTVIE